MTRPLLRLVVSLAVVCGAALGAVGALVLSTPGAAVVREAATQPHGPAHLHGPAHPQPAAASSALDPPQEPTRPSVASAPGLVVPPPPPPDLEGLLLVWTAGGLPAAVAEVAAIQPAVTGWSEVRADQAGLVGVEDADGGEVLALADGWQVPLDVLAVDPDAHAPFVSDLSGPVDGATMAALGPGQALLSVTSAGLRGVAAGAVLTLANGEEVQVAGVLDDLAASGAELVVHTADAARLGVDTPRFMLLSHTGARADVQASLADAVGPTPVRFRTPAETTWLRHGDAVLPQALLKREYGEFAIRLVAGRDVMVAQAWEVANIAVEDIAILGTVRCHRLILPRLAAAMEELSRRNLAHLVDAETFAGCYVPRRIAPGQPLSRHAWGLAVDLNVGDNPRGSFSTQDPRLVETMRDHGFAWGGTWLVPDPAHYEVVSTEAW